MSGKDSNALVAWLRTGLRYRELVHERKISSYDWRQGNWHDA